MFAKQTNTKETIKCFLIQLFSLADFIAFATRAQLCYLTVFISFFIILPFKYVDFIFFFLLSFCLLIDYLSVYFPYSLPISPEWVWLRNQPVSNKSHSRLQLIWRRHHFPTYNFFPYLFFVFLSDPITS